MTDSPTLSSAQPLIRVDDDPAALPRDQWNALLAASPLPSPFMKLEYLAAMEASGSAVSAKGWQAQFISVWEGDTLIAACPAYLKGHSYGEYVNLCRLQSSVPLAATQISRDEYRRSRPPPYLDTNHCRGLGKGKASRSQVHAAGANPT